MKMTVSQYLTLRFKSEKIKVETEYKFLSDRKFRFDFCIPKIMTAIESEGGMFSEKSRHRTGVGYINDCEKYNHATAMGWQVYRVATIEQAGWVIEVIKSQIK
jgi:hypothetical protein